jgi:hypothetical protein
MPRNSMGPSQHCLQCDFLLFLWIAFLTDNILIIFYSMMLKEWNTSET